MKYDIYQSKINRVNNKEENFVKLTKIDKILFQNSLLSKNKILKLYYTYDKLINSSQNLVHLNLNSQLLLISNQSQNWLTEMSNFSFLKQQIKEILPKFQTIQQLIRLRYLIPTIYFIVMSWRKPFSILFGKNESAQRSPNPSMKRSNNNDQTYIPNSFNGVVGSVDAYFARLWQRPNTPSQLTVAGRFS